MDKIDLAGINPERRKTPEASVTEREKIQRCELSVRAMPWPCTQTDAKRACALVSMFQSSLPVATVGTLMKSNRILQGDAGQKYECTHIRNARSWLWWSVSGQQERLVPQLLVSSQELQQRESCKVEDMV